MQTIKLYKLTSEHYKLNYWSDFKACPSRPSSHQRGSSVTTVLQEPTLAPTRGYGRLADAPRRGRGLGERHPGGCAGRLGEEDFWTTAIRYVLQHWDSQELFCQVVYWRRRKGNYLRNSPKAFEIGVSSKSHCKYLGRTFTTIVLEHTGWCWIHVATLIQSLFCFSFRSRGPVKFCSAWCITAPHGPPHNGGVHPSGEPPPAYFVEVLLGSPGGGTVLRRGWIRKDRPDALFTTCLWLSMCQAAIVVFLYVQNYHSYLQILCIFNFGYLIFKPVACSLLIFPFGYLVFLILVQHRRKCVANSLEQICLKECSNQFCYIVVIVYLECFLERHKLCLGS